MFKVKQSMFTASFPLEEDSSGVCRVDRQTNRAISWNDIHNTSNEPLCTEFYGVLIWKLSVSAMDPYIISKHGRLQFIALSNRLQIYCNTSKRQNIAQSRFQATPLSDRVHFANNSQLIWLCNILCYGCSTSRGK